ncbi:Tetratricopeptide repeat-containing protein, partial [Fibrobacter intestinalis]
MATTVEFLRKSIGKKKQSMAFAWLADLMRQRGDLDEALQCARSGLAAFPESLEGRLVLSQILEEKQDWDGVIEACEYVLLRNTYCLSALRRMYVAYAAKEDLANRNRYYQMLRDLDPFWKEPAIDEALEQQMSALEMPVETTAAVAIEDTSLDKLLQEQPLDLPVAEEPLLEKSLEVASEQSAVEEEDPFASFASMTPTDDENDGEVSFNDLEHSLNDAIAGFAPTNTEKDFFPVDEIEGNDISAALSGIFGTQETESETLPEEKAMGAVEEASPESFTVPKAEDKPQTLSDAFDDIFGEDELPEEFVPTKSAPSNENVSPTAESIELPPTTGAETPAETSPSASGETLDLDTDVSQSFDSLFGKDSDDIPTESIELPTTSSVETPAETAPASPSETLDLDTDVSQSFDSLFGKDSDDVPVESLELPPTTGAETPAETSPSASGETLDLDTDVSQSFDSLFGKDSDDIPTESIELPTTSSVETPAETAPASPSETLDLDTDVSQSFDSLFGKDSDDVLAESLELPTTSSVETPAEAAPAAPSDTLDLGADVSQSFDSLFGKESDDVPVESLELPPAASVETPAETSPSASGETLDLDA